jgi:hypothetical protein
VTGPATLTATHPRVVGAPDVGAERRRGSSARCQKHASRVSASRTPSRPASTASDLVRDLGRCAAATDQRDEWARFLTRDPLVATTQEPYAYAGNDPVNMVDPLGLEKNCVSNSGVPMKCPPSSARPSQGNVRAGLEGTQRSDDALAQRSGSAQSQACTTPACRRAIDIAGAGSFVPGEAVYRNPGTREAQEAGSWWFISNVAATSAGVPNWVGGLFSAVDLMLRGQARLGSPTPYWAGSEATKRYCDISGIPKYPY